MFKQHRNTDPTASTPSVTLNFYKLNKYGMFQPRMVFSRNYKAFMIFQPWRTHKSTAALPVYIPRSITGSMNSGVEPQRSAILADSAGIQWFVPRNTMKLLRVHLSDRQKPVGTRRWSDICCFAIVTAIVRLYMWFYELACVFYKTFNSSKFKSGLRDWKATEENLF